MLDNHRSVFVIGDVAGRGPVVGHAARVLTAYARSVLAGGASLNDGLLAIDDFFTRALLNDSVPFASMLIAVTDPDELTLRYASAGHEPGFLFEDAGHHERLSPTAPLFGLRMLKPWPARVERALRLVGKSVLVLVTDGITEAQDGAGKARTFFGSTGVVRSVHRAGLQGADLPKAIHRAAERYARNGFRDDATVIVARIAA